jgi:hypothetical protein
VRVINLRDGDSIASVTAVPKTEEAEDIPTADVVNEAIAEGDAPVVESMESGNE